MTSKIKVDNINKVSDDSNIIKKCGTTTTIGSGASNPIVVDGSAITLGRCGGTVALASGATQTGFGRTGTVDWQTGSIKTSTFTATSGEGYFVNTTGGAVTVNLPAGVAGAIVGIKDYAGTFAVNGVTVNPNGSDNIGGGNITDPVLGTNGQSLLFVFVDSTQGWLSTQQSEAASPSGAQSFVCASVSGSCNAIVTSGDFKTAIFKGPGNFTVNSIASDAPNNVVEYLVVAGGASGGSGRGGGGGAGGFRIFSSTPPITPLTAPAGITVTAQAYPISVGGGGAAKSFPPAGRGNNGSNSTFDSITSTGGGAGGAGPGSDPSSPGGSGGGGAFNVPGDSGGAGNTPPVTPAQGTNGVASSSSAPDSGPNRHGGGGGGAAGAGGPGSPPNNGPECGGIGSYIADAFVGPTAPSYGTPGLPLGRAFAGGGGAGFQCSGGGIGGEGGGGTGANTSNSPTGNGTANTGGGGGGVGENPGTQSGGGGSGIIMIRYKFQ